MEEDAEGGAPAEAPMQAVAEPVQRQLSSPLPAIELIEEGSDEPGQRQLSSPLPETQIVVVASSEAGQEAVSPVAVPAALPDVAGGAAEEAGEAAEEQREEESERPGEEEPSAATVPVVVPAEAEGEAASDEEPAAAVVAQQHQPATAASAPAPAAAPEAEEPQVWSLAGEAAAEQPTAGQPDAAPAEDAIMLPLHELSPLVGTVLPPPSQFPESQLRGRVPPTPAAALPGSEPYSGAQLGWLTAFRLSNCLCKFFHACRMPLHRTFLLIQLVGSLPQMRPA